jgi:hypothetical protein
MHPIVTGVLAVGILDILAAFAVRYAFTRTAPTRTSSQLHPHDGRRPHAVGRSAARAAHVPQNVW